MWVTLGAVWIVCMVAGAMLGSIRGNATFGFIWPLVLGPPGLLLAFFLLREGGESVRTP